MPFENTNIVRRDNKIIVKNVSALGDGGAIEFYSDDEVTKVGEITAAGVGDFATLKIGGTAITPTAAELNLLDGTERIVRTEVVAIAAVDTAGGVFAWSPGAAVIIQRVFLDVTTKATGACTVDVGVAVNGTTLADTLIDGLDVNAATGLFDNITDKGTNGKSRQRCGATQYVTGSVASGASAGIVGNAYIEYVLVYG